MKFLFVSNPATGQVNPLLAISHELLTRGHEVHFISADRLQNNFNKMAVKANASDRARFHGVGSGRALEDLGEIIKDRPDMFHNNVRHRPGALAQYLTSVTDLEPLTPEVNATMQKVVFAVRDLCHEILADIIVVDNFSPFAMDGVRLSALPFIQTSPAAACAAVSYISLFSNSVGLSGSDSGVRKADGSMSLGAKLFMIWRNLSFVFSFVWWCISSDYAKEKRRFRKEDLGLPSVDFLSDSYMTPAPHLVPQMVAAMSFNVAGLDLYTEKNFDKKVFFVGPCFAPGHGPKAIQQVQSHQPDSVKEWLDESDETIYVNMGSIFFYSRDDYLALIEGLKQVKVARPNMRALIKIPDLPFSVQPIPGAHELPSWIRREAWIPSVEAVLSHPSVKVAMHHGGGNSFNEAVGYGMPQYIVSQWGETHDIMAYGIFHGIALGSQRAPKIDAKDISVAMVELLKDNAKFRKTALRWKLRSEQSGGTIIAADICESYAKELRSDKAAARGQPSEIHDVEKAIMAEESQLTTVSSSVDMSPTATTVGSPTFAAGGSPKVKTAAIESMA